MPDYNTYNESRDILREVESNNLQFIADKYEVSIEDIKLIIERAGNNRKVLENELHFGRHNIK